MINKFYYHVSNNNKNNNEEAKKKHLIIKNGRSNHDHCMSNDHTVIVYRIIIIQGEDVYTSRYKLQSLTYLASLNQLTIRRSSSDQRIIMMITVADFY